MSLKVPPTLQGKYPAKEHAKRVTAAIKEHHSDLGTSNVLLYLESTKSRLNEDNDQEAPFRQRRYFYYLTGCELPDSAFIYDVDQDLSTLYIPPVDEDEVIWSGLPLSVEEAAQAYDVDQVETSDKLKDGLAKNKDKTVFAIKDQTDFPAFKELDFGTRDLNALKTAIEDCRVFKDAYEIALIKHANTISAIAHREVMKAASKAMNERELEALFIMHCARNGARNQAYSAIIASGTDAATLHYVRNDKALLTADIGEMQIEQEKPGPPPPLNLLIDAGAEFRCYASDVTRTYALNGSFTKESKQIYSLVLKIQKACIDILKAGIEWEECHLLAHKILIDGLLDLGILNGGSAEELLKSRISTAFLPHGLGHYMGMDTHDTGGKANYADKDPMFRYLRVRGKVPAGAVITVEPGCYFCRFIIEPRLTTEDGKRYIDAEVLEKYWSVGGVRIEDDLLVKNDGCENLTDLPSSIEDLESIVRG